MHYTAKICLSILRPRKLNKREKSERENWRLLYTTAVLQTSIIISCLYVEDELKLRNSRQEMRANIFYSVTAYLFSIEQK